jgi:hypothetical protein
MSSAETVRKATMATTTPVVFQAHKQKTTKTKDTSSTQSVGTEVKAGGNLNIIATEGISAVKARKSRPKAMHCCMPKTMLIC